MFIGIGIAFAWGATNYNVGTGAKMGAGYFPFVLGVIMCILGAVTLFKSLVVESEDGGKIGAWAWKPLFFILLANLVFGSLLVGLPFYGIPPFGLIVAIYALTFVASCAGSNFRARETFVVATILAAGSYVAFVWALKLQFPVWPDPWYLQLLPFVSS